jgi:hypothetical protein
VFGFVPERTLQLLHKTGLSATHETQIGPGLSDKVRVLTDSGKHASQPSLEGLKAQILGGRWGPAEPNQTFSCKGVPIACDAPCRPWGTPPRSSERDPLCSRFCSAARGVAPQRRSSYLTYSPAVVRNTVTILENSCVAQTAPIGVVHAMRHTLRLCPGK